MQIAHVTRDNMRRIFQVEVWLLDEQDGVAYFPENDGYFLGLIDEQVLTVQGSDDLNTSRAQAVENTVTVSSCSPRNLPPPPTFRSVIASKSREPKYKS